MPAQRSIMKNRGLPSSKWHGGRDVFSAAALLTVFLVISAVVFCHPAVMAAAASGTVQEDDKDPEETLNNSGNPEKPEQGILILEDPNEKTRYAEYEMAVGDSFSISFIHSVNKSPVTDYFEVREDGIYGVKTVYYGFGAGVPTELGEGQTLTYGDDGSMIISGMDVKMNSLIYRVGTVSDHILALKDESEISLRELCGRSARVGFRFEIYGGTEKNIPEGHDG